MTTNARDEKWSEWKPHSGGPQPIANGTIVEPKLRDGTHDLACIAEDYRWQWNDDDRGGDIIAYRYKIEDPSGISEADEEECIQLAYERMNDESIPTSIKQLRYQDAKGEDWIDEFARTASVDEFRGAMKFTLGKYTRRAGKKDALQSEIEKIGDYARRWAEYERKLDDAL